MFLVEEKVKVEISTHQILQQIRKLKLQAKKMVVQQEQQNKLMPKRQQRRGMYGCRRYLSPS